MRQMPQLSSLATHRHVATPIHLKNPQHVYSRQGGELRIKCEIPPQQIFWEWGGGDVHRLTMNGPAAFTSRMLSAGT